MSSGRAASARLWGLSFPAGTRLGPYEIIGPLGAGGMGEVYQARDTRLGRLIAIKVLPSEVAADPQRLARFEQEARAASALNHPNIVTIHEVGREDGVVFLVMEQVEGRTLRSLIQQGPLPVRKVLQIAAQAAAGLAKAHGAGIVHRDIKPDNLMVSDDGVVKILDFGLAKSLHAGESSDSRLQTIVQAATNPGMVVGTIDYMSPEQARGAELDERSDQFSLGTVMYEMLTGVRPFQGGSAPQTLTAIIEKTPAPLEREAGDVPMPLKWVVERCLSKDPPDRYASTLDLARDLRFALEHLSELPATSAGPAAASAGSPSEPCSVSRRP